MWSPHLLLLVFWLILVLWFSPFTSVIVTARLTLLVCLFIVPSLIHTILWSCDLFLCRFDFLLFSDSINIVLLLQFWHCVCAVYCTCFDTWLVTSYYLPMQSTPPRTHACHVYVRPRPSVSFRVSFLHSAVPNCTITPISYPFTAIHTHPHPSLESMLHHPVFCLIW